MIDKFNVKSYHGDPQKGTLRVVWQNDRWQVAKE